MLAQADFPLAVSRDLMAMDPRLFRPEPTGLQQARPQAMASNMAIRAF